MKNKKVLIGVIAIVVIFAVAVAVTQATTIGTNISTGGSVTSTGNLSSAGNLIIGNGTPGVTQDGEDGYIEGTFEIDGASQFDGVVTANGGVIIPTGSVSASSVAFSGDSNTGFYSTGADNLSITVGGTQRFSASEDTQAVTITGTTTLTGGTASVLNLGDVISTGEIKIGEDQTTGAITIGSLNKTGKIIVGTSTASNTIDIGNASTAAGYTQIVNIGNAGGSNSATQVNIGSGGYGTTTVSVGGTGGASSVYLNSGTGNGNISLRANGTDRLVISHSTQSITLTGTTTISNSVTIGGGSTIAKIVKGSLPDDTSGWAPDNSTISFTITADAASVTATSVIFVTLDGWSTGGGGPGCDVIDIVASTSFRVGCNTGPQNGWVLNYMIVN